MPCPGAQANPVAGMARTEVGDRVTTTGESIVTTDEVITKRLRQLTRTRSRRRRITSLPDLVDSISAYGTRTDENRERSPGGPRASIDDGSALSLGTARARPRARSIALRGCHRRATGVTWRESCCAGSVTRTRRPCCGSGARGGPREGRGSVPSLASGTPSSVASGSGDPAPDAVPVAGLLRLDGDTYPADRGPARDGAHDAAERLALRQLERLHRLIDADLPA
jgi:hypothetical protein